MRIAAVRPDGILLLGDGRLARLAGLDAGSLRGTELPGPAVMHPSGPPDRHGILPVDFEGAKSALALVAAGKARVRPRPGEQACLPALLAAEQGARGSGPGPTSGVASGLASGLGLWGDPGYAIGDASDEAAIGRELGRFVILEGRVSHVGMSSAGTSRGRLYIDFGPIWRDDVTLIIASQDLARFRAAGLDPERLEGRRVRARGVVVERGGPALLVTEPLAIEVIDGASVNPVPRAAP